MSARLVSFDQKRTELTPGTVLVREWDRRSQRVMVRPYLDELPLCALQPCVLLLERFDCALEQKHIGGFPSWDRQRVRWLLLVSHDEGVPPHEAKTPHPETFLCR